MIWTIAAVAALLFFVIGDTVTTWYGLTHMDGIVEANPHARIMFEHIGIAGAFIIYKAIPFGATVMLSRVGHWATDGLSLVLMIFLAAVGIFAVANNLSVILLSKPLLPFVP